MKRIASEVPTQASCSPSAVAALWIQFVELSRAACGGYGDSISETAQWILNDEVSRVADRRECSVRKWIVQHKFGAYLLLRSIQKVVISKIGRGILLPPCETVHIATSRKLDLLVLTMC
jgi:hypothetical protein